MQKRGLSPSREGQLPRFKRAETPFPTSVASLWIGGPDRRLSQWTSQFIGSRRLGQQWIHGGAAGWGWAHTGDIDTMVRDFGVLKYSVECWAGGFIISGQEALNSLPDESKRNVIKNLEGWCVQEDWETLTKPLPGTFRSIGAIVLVETLLMKDLFEKMIGNNPFWYFDGKAGPDDENESENFPIQLEHLYHRFIQTNPFSAGYWRSETIRLSNSVRNSQAPDLTLGQYHQDRVKASVQKFASEFLAREDVQSLLISDEKTEQYRSDALLRVYERAAEFSQRMMASPGLPKFYGLEELGQKYSKECKLTTLCASNGANIPAHTERLDGQRIMIVKHPALTFTCTDARQSHEDVAVCFEAQIWVEDPHTLKG
ncbi:hypothetical protein ATEIFO6365_0004079700 [Aspergillus terreus]|uniref:Uncharacterized protein n=1 Tax=Aspergillus terreus TaxID=33178 RepID=A0A5M3YSE3_ASPTE|nr:hypothetical protein ATETN484_0002082200 [Aspergillus terreus]GFF15678.1 hypothetical protein ATEIFO6365_0004079700 [Aspergillus terreus]